MGKVETAIRDEIKRLARRVTREMQARTVGDIRRLKGKVAALQQEINALKSERASAQAKARIASAGKAMGGVVAQKVRLSPRLIKKLRKKLNITQPQLATLVGVSSAAVASWEAGKSNPRPESKVRVAGLRKLGRRDVRRLLAEKAAPAKPARAVKKSRKRKKKK
jgi:DNA-binding transcriptional regulator YiaG